MLWCGLRQRCAPCQQGNACRYGGYATYSYHTPWPLTRVLCRMLDLLANRLSLRDPLRPLGVRPPGGGSSAASVPQILLRSTGDRAMGPACTHRRYRRLAPGKPQPWHGPLRSGSVREPVRRLNRATVGGLVIDDDRDARVQLLPDLPDFGVSGCEFCQFP